MRTSYLIALLLWSIVPVNAQLIFKTGNGELDANLNQINISANADFGKFKTNLGIAYNIPEQRIEYLHSELRMEPAEIYFTLEVSSVCHKPVDEVIEVYKSNRGKGWGKIAKQLGIKPGSSEFHELKERVKNKSGNGNENSNDKEKQNHGKGKGKGKNH